MPVGLHKNHVLPIFEAISIRKSQNLGADYFALIIVDSVLMQCDLLINKKTNETAQLEKELQKVAPNTWELCSQQGFNPSDENDELLCTKPICNVFAKTLHCRKALTIPFELVDIGGGFLVWGWHELPSDYSKSYAEKAAFITEQVALSLKLSLKEKIGQELNAKLAALLELSTAIYSSLNYTEVLEKAINLATKIVGANGGTIFTLDKKSDLLRPLITVDEHHEEEISKITLKLGEGLTGLVAQSGIGLISNHSESDPRTYHVPGTPPDEQESLISAPLTWSGEVIGAVTLRSSKAKQFVQDDLDILTIFARQTADAIENAKLFQSLEKAYKELSTTQEQLILTEKLRALGEMAGGVAHDFNNVLGTVLGRTQLLLREIKNSKWLDQLRQIEEVTLRGAKTVQKLQNFTRVSGRGQYEQIDLNKVIADAVEMTKPRWKDDCQRQGVVIVLTFERGELLPILGNQPDLVEAFSNIILNAVDALTEGGYIKIKSYMKDDQAVVTIKDSGVGMADNTLNRMFFPFFTTKGKQGTGMGLAVVYGIVTRHKVEIDVDSKPGVGTTFTLSFQTTAKAKIKPAAVSEFKDEIKARALVIDDDASILEVIGDILKFMGHEVSLAATGEEGVEQFKKGDFNIVITDLGMPGISGWEVARICKSLKPDVPVVMISGWGNQIDDEMVRQSKLDGILAKPFEMNKIKTLVQNALAAKLKDTADVQSKR